MDSRWNPEGGYSIPHGREFLLGSSPWGVSTPEKSIPPRAHATPIHQNGSMQDDMNWPELAGLRNSYSQDMPYYNRGSVQGLNLEMRAPENEYLGDEAVFLPRQQMMNHIADSSVSDFGMDGASWANSSFMDLLTSNDFSFGLSVDGTLSSGLNIAQKPWSLSYPSSSSCEGFTSHNILTASQKNAANTNTSSKDYIATPIPQYGFPLHSWQNYDLNSTPVIDVEPLPSITKSLHFTPVTPDQAKTRNHQLSAVLNSSAAYENTIQEKEKQEMFPLTSHEATHNHSDELLQNIVESFTQKQEVIKQSNKSIDLNSTPQLKQPKRKRHRPKVILEGKPKRTRKSATQENPSGKDNPSGKRKYVRKKGLKQSVSQQADAAQETVVSNDRLTAKSCRRALNFDLEKTADASTIAGKGGVNILQASSSCAESQTSELYRTAHNVSGIISAQQIGQQDRLVMVCQPEILNMLNTSADQRPCEFIPEPERLVNCPPVKITDKPGHYASTQDVGWAMGLDCQNGPTDGQFLGQQQFVHARVGQFNAPGPDNLMKSQQVVPPSASLIFSHSNEARGIKRDLQHTNNQTYLLNANSGHPQFLAQQMCQNDECWKSSSILNSTSMVIQKKKKTEKGLDINSTSTSVSAVDDFSGQTSIAGLTGEITFKTSVKKPEMLKSYEASDSINLEGPNILNRYTNELFLRSSAMSFKSREHQISIEQHSYQQRKDTNRSQVKDIGVTAYEKYHQNQMVPETTALLGNKEMPRKQHAILSAKNTAGPTKQKSSKEKFQKEQGNLSCKDQFSIAMMKGSSSSSMERDPNSLNKIIYRLKMLNLGEGSNMKEADQHAIVPYKGVGTIVPYEGLEHIRRRKPRPKVDLDPETNRIWNLLMGKEKGGLEENDEEKEKRWEEEREVFRGRANSFIARMHLVQGDRRFSQWKGSVVDSVIGVFLTQNVSDHLSSSAFMSLAARFPQKPTCYGRDCGKNQTNILVKEPEIIMLNPTNTIRFHTKTQPIYSKNSVTLQEPTECWQVNEIPGTERMKLLEGQTHSSEEEGLSSQESFDCSINESIGGIRSYSGSNSESEDLIVGQRPEEICYSNLETTSQKEKFIVQDLNIHPSQNTITYENNQSKGKTYNLQNSGLDSTNSINGTSLSTCLMNYDAQSSHFPPAAFIPHKLQINSTSGMPRVEDTETFGEESISSWPRAAKFSDSGANRIANQIKLKESQSKTLVYRSVLRHPQETRVLSHHASLSTTNSFPQSSISGPDLTISQPSSILHQCESENIFHYQTSLPTDSEIMGHSDYGRQCNHLQHESFSPSQKVNVRDRISKADDHSHQESVVLKPNSEEQQSSSSKPHKETSIEPANAKRGKAKVEKTSKIDWDILRRNVQVNGQSKERSADAVDSIDYEAIRQASVSEISNCIKERGMNNMLAERIKGFLDRLVQDHGSIDLEWLRDISPDKAKDYLLSVRGLGLKSVECVRLLTLRHLAFPVDTNVGRIAVRLGWVPLQPLPESLQLHLLELYPVLESIQKYLWPRLCKLDQRTLYELHYQLITFGKVFCTKSKPNCNACPMRGECRHFASAFASARLALPAPEEKSLVCSTVPLAESEPETMINLKPLQPPYSSKAMSGAHSCEPIIEEPATPDEERAVALESDIEDVLNHDDEEIPTIKLNMQEFTENLQQFMQENKMELQEGDMSKALVAINPEAASIPARKLKNVSRLRTEHQVYELPDDHPLLQGLQKRELDDPSPYLLAIWTPGETANSVQQSQEGCKLQNSGNLCNERTCFSCNSIREANSQTVRGTLLIPCRTAMKGSFPLNGTYFQVNEVFADHESSENPIHVPRDSIWSLRRRTVYFGTSVTTIFRGLSTEEIQYCFWRGFVCVRGFHRSSRAPRPLVARLHFPASKAKTKK